MRQRQSPSTRLPAILDQARALFVQRGYGAVEMEEIRLACGLSRGGLYHHFGSKAAILLALVEAEVLALTQSLDQNSAHPLAVLLDAGSVMLGQSPGLVSAMVTPADRVAFLNCLDTAMAEHLAPALTQALTPHVTAPPAHVSELFLTVNARLNWRVLVQGWSPPEAAGFGATALRALLPLLRNPDALQRHIREMQDISRRSPLPPDRATQESAAADQTPRPKPHTQLGGLDE